MSGKKALQHCGNFTPQNRTSQYFCMNYHESKNGSLNVNVLWTPFLCVSSLMSASLSITSPLSPPTGERGPYWQALLHATAPHRTRRKPFNVKYKILSQKYFRFLISLLTQVLTILPGGASQGAFHHDQRGARAALLNKESAHQ